MQKSILANVQQDVDENISFLLDEYGRVLSINQASKSLGKHFSTSIFGKYVWRIFSAMSENAPTESEWKDFLSGRIQSLEVENLLPGRKNKRKLVVRQLMSKADQKTYMVSSLPDMDTFSKQLIQRDAEMSRLQKLYTESPLGIVLEINDERELVRFNDRFCEILGYERAELKMRSIESITHPDDLDSHKPYYQRLLDGSLEQCCFYKRFIKKNGSTVYGKIYMSRIIDETGKVRNIATLDDETERIKAKSKIRTNLELLEKLVDRSPLGVICFLPSGQIIRVNQEFCRIFGYREDELKGQFYTLMTYPDDMEKETQIINTIIQRKSDSQFNFDKRCLHKNGDVLWVSLSLSFVKSTSLEKSYIMAQVKDITEGVTARADLKSKAAELERYMKSNKQLENFAYFASHDLREPLRSIQSFTGLLQEQYSDVLDEQGLECMKYIVDSSRRMSNLIESLLEYSRVNSNELPHKPVPLETLLEQIQLELDTAIKEKQAIIHLKDLPDTLMGVPAQLRQLFQNLIANAIKYSKKDISPVIEISGKERGSQWYLMVEDNGIGIEEKNFEKIFGLFGKLHSRKEFEGSGLGLALCKNIVESHGGKIWVTSEFGKGTCFHILLPQ